LTFDWKTVVRETSTDSEGRFSLAPVKGRKVYYLEITVPGMSGVNPFRVSVKINRLLGKGIAASTIATCIGTGCQTVVTRRLHSQLD
jgi:hypothetical protein